MPRKALYGGQFHELQNQHQNDRHHTVGHEGLRQGGGVCGAIFSAAGSWELQEACAAIGYCPTGNAVITPGFRLKAKYIIHAVGPIWMGGTNGEVELLYSAYINALRLAAESGCTSIGFPLISAGIYGYPMEQAWEVALSACRDFGQQNPDVSMDIVFAVLSEDISSAGQDVLKQILDAELYKGC